MMKKWFIIIFVIFLVFIAGCSGAKKDGSTTNNDLQKIDSNEHVAQTDNSASDKTDRQMDLVKNCDFLNASDIAEICGSDVNMTKKDTIFGPCTFSFTNSADHDLGLIYYQYPPSDSKERSYEYCLSKGEKVDEFICADENNVYVFGDYYSISLGHSMEYSSDIVCSFEQIKELGKLVKQRIYG